MAMHFEALKMYFFVVLGSRKNALTLKYSLFDLQKGVGEVGRAMTYLRAPLPGDI